MLLPPSLGQTKTYSRRYELLKTQAISGRVFDWEAARQLLAPPEVVAHPKHDRAVPSHKRRATRRLRRPTARGTPKQRPVLGGAAGRRCRCPRSRPTRRRGDPSRPSCARSDPDRRQRPASQSAVRTQALADEGTDPMTALRLPATASRREPPPMLALSEDWPSAQRPRPPPHFVVACRTRVRTRRHSSPQDGGDDD